MCSSFCWVVRGFRSSVLPRSSREHQDHRQRGQRGCRSFLPLGPDRLIASAQLRQDLSTSIARMGAKGLKGGKNKEFFGVAWCFVGLFGHPKRAKPKIFLKSRGKRGVFRGLAWLRSLVALGACLGAVRGFPWASALIVHQHTKTARFRLFGAIAFLDCFQISVLRAF